MTKKDIVRTISESLEIPQVLVKDIVQATLDEIIRGLANDGRIELRNFGIFEVRHYKPRRARNPQTKKELRTKARYAVRFKSGKDMGKIVHATQTAKAKSAKRAAKKAAAEPSPGN